jgi:hypothetical protein
VVNRDHADGQMSSVRAGMEAVDGDPAAIQPALEPADIDFLSSRKNEALLRQRMLVSHVHRKKPAGRPMPNRTARANANKSAVRAHIEHVFAEQKARMGLVVRTIGLARATTKIGLANLVTNMRRLLWLERQPALA